MMKRNLNTELIFHPDKSVCKPRFKIDNVFFVCFKRGYFTHRAPAVSFPEGVEHVISQDIS